MESRPQNPEFRINPESFHPCQYEFILWMKSIMDPDHWKPADLDLCCF